MNYFEYKSVAERYARHRPYFHPLVIEKVKSYLSIAEPVDLAVDVGCGPGQSTVALKEIARRTLVSAVLISWSVAPETPAARSHPFETRRASR